VYENRMLRAFSFQVDQRMRALGRATRRTGSETSLAKELTSLADRLRSARRQAKFLDEVSLPRHLPTRTTMVLMNRPEYRSVFQGFLEFQKIAAMRVDEPKLDAPIQNVPYLYQLWGTMSVIDALCEVATETGYRVLSQCFLKREFGGLCVRILPGGMPALELVHPETRTVVKLIPEETYGKSGDLHSISFRQRPDIAIEVQSPGQPTTVYLFDPKYKLSSESGEIGTDERDEPTPMGMPKKVDIDKMHSYRDAIRDANLHRAVHYAAILYPGPEKRYADNIEALHAYPGHTDQLKDRLFNVLTMAVSSSGLPNENRVVSV